ncbi:UNVERIFIED_CONTAM: hypothetical protein GTU68_021419 [Idotea baltica]|nr:hypothetical protein [Idotea baltica]
MLAQPLVTIDNFGYKRSAADVAAIAIEREAKRIVVGLPLELDGNRGPQARKVDKFTKQLKRHLTDSDLDLEVVQWDERMTTVYAERIIAGSKLKGSERSGQIDRVAAALILESYLAQEIS